MSWFVTSPQLGAVVLAWMLFVGMAWHVQAEDEPQERAGGPDPQLFDRLDANSDDTVSADEIPEQAKRLFERLVRNSDKNQDGQLSRAEFEAGLTEKPLQKGAAAARPGFGGRQFDPQAIFDRLDQDGDGKLALEDFPAERQDRLRQVFPKIDQDGDGKLSVEEFRKMASRQRGQRPGPPRRGPGLRGPRSGDFPPPPLLKALDANHDGQLDRSEIENAAEALRTLDRNSDGIIDRAELGPPGRPGQTAGRQGRPGQGRPGQGRPGQGRGAEMFAKRLMQQDANGDGKLSREEVPERMGQRFDTIDANSDGFLDEAELKEMLQKVFSRGQGRRPQRPDAE